MEVNGFHSPPGKPFFCPLKPPKGMFAHQPSCSHRSDPKLHSTSMEILPAIENSDLISAGCQFGKGSQGRRTPGLNFGMKEDLRQQ